jgi:hypothetical protein
MTFVDYLAVAVILCTQIACFKMGYNYGARRSTDVCVSAWKTHVGFGHDAITANTDRVTGDRIIQDWITRTSESPYLREQNDRN